MGNWDAELTDLVTHRGRALLSYAYMLSGHPREAEDLVQDALVKVCSRLRRPASSADTYDLDAEGPTDPEGYVRRAILTLYLDRYRRRQRWSALKHLVPGNADVRGADHAANARVDVSAALRRLTPKQRTCIVLRYFEDLTVPQIAAATGMAEGTVKRHLFDAMSPLRGALGDLDEAKRTTPGTLEGRAAR
ncbi:sigma-70 family RNA polymerase sigma factor [Antribacter gilvus]|uniref:sigma-70 family RNA polymerase sigma factor n=1 Tax=Antribacter gilvus TaxID=2304675 RepID=UPI000F77CF9C|nr:sigma-70 family RNA polymerase sigma factor [Antribacter gilvus]